MSHWKLNLRRCSGQREDSDLSFIWCKLFYFSLLCSSLLDSRNGKGIIIIIIINNGKLLLYLLLSTSLELVVCSPDSLDKSVRCHGDFSLSRHVCLNFSTKKKRKWKMVFLEGSEESKSRFQCVVYPG